MSGKSKNDISNREKRNKYKISRLMFADTQQMFYLKENGTIFKNNIKQTPEIPVIHKMPIVILHYIKK